MIYIYRTKNKNFSRLFPIYSTFGHLLCILAPANIELPTASKNFFGFQFPPPPQKSMYAPIRLPPICSVVNCIFLRNTIPLISSVFDLIAVV